MVPAVPALPVPSSPLSPRKWLKGRPFFHRLIMEVDRKEGHRETEASCQVHRKQHWIVNLPRCQAAVQRLHHFLSLTLFDLNKGLVIPVLNSPAKQEGRKGLPKTLCWPEYSICYGEVQGDYISLCATKDKRKLLSVFWNVSKDLASCKQRRILLELSCPGRQTQREGHLMLWNEHIIWTSGWRIFCGVKQPKWNLYIERIIPYMIYKMYGN